MLCMPRTNCTVDSVGGDDQVSIRNLSRHFSAEFEIGTQLQRTILENLQKLFARDSTEAVTTRRDPPPMHEYVDVIPVSEVLGYRLERRLVSSMEVLQRLIGEYDTPAEGVIGAVPLADRNIVPGVRLLQ